MYIQKDLIESNEYHKYIFTLHDYKDNSLKFKESEAKGNIQFIISFDELICTIVSFNIAFESKGYGTILLNEVIDILKKKYTMIRTIELDDMTDRYRQSNNIYIKFGFTYKADHGPEMIYLL
jgi:hypothetical protein